MTVVLMPVRTSTVMKFSHRLDTMKLMQLFLSARMLASRICSITSSVSSRNAARIYFSSPGRNLRFRHRQIPSSRRMRYWTTAFSTESTSFKMRSRSVWRRKNSRSSGNTYFARISMPSSYVPLEGTTLNNFLLSTSVWYCPFSRLKTKTAS